MNRPKVQRTIIASLGSVAGFVLCGTVLIMVDPAMDLNVIRLLSALAGIVLAGIMWKAG
jgi:hypothetical protein